jgi:hypothetical protein
MAEALAEPTAEAWCGRPGQPCKREALAEAEANAEAWCGRPGQPCRKAKRDAFALAYAADVALSQL